MSPAEAPAGGAAGSPARRRLRSTSGTVASHRRGSQPSTRSRSTAPASTEASWSASPTSTSRAPARTASSSRAIIVSDTIEVSSTTTTSCGSGLPAWWRKRVRLSGREPSSRCTVEAVSPRTTSRRSYAGSPRCRSRSAPGKSGLLGRRPDRLRHPGRRLAGRRGERDPQRPAVGLQRQQHPEEPGDGRRLAGAGPAGDDGGAVPAGGLGRGTLVGVRRVGEVGCRALRPGRPPTSPRRPADRRGGSGRSTTWDSSCQ